MFNQETYPNLHSFVSKYNYNLLDYITFNSYRTGERSEVRDYDSISVTEVLSLIEDPTLEFAKRFHSEKMKEAQNFGTEHHDIIDKVIKANVSTENVEKEYLPPTEIMVTWKLFTIKEKPIIADSEVYGSKEFGELPLVTAKVDALGILRGNDSIIDWKISKGARNFKSIKYHIQMAGYRWAFDKKHSCVVYLNPKGYSLSFSEDIEYFDAIWLELLGYANELYITGAFHDKFKT